MNGRWLVLFVGLVCQANAQAQSGAAPPVRYGLDDVMLEGAALGSRAPADQAWALRASPWILGQPSRALEWRAGLRADVASQTGGSTNFDRTRLTLGDTFLRWRQGDTRLTVGAQTILWGRVDEVSILDRVSRVDLTRFLVDNLPQRRLPQWALRWEQSFGDDRLDAVVLPAFEGARLPDDRSVWALVNRRSGEIIGSASSPALAAFARQAPLRQQDGGFGGAALRWTRTGVAPVDFGFTLARTRQSLPALRADLAAGVLRAEHPFTTFAGVDVEFATAGLTWRSEFGVTHGQPATAVSGRPLSLRAWEWVGAVEFFPGGEDTRVSLQLASRSLRNREPLLELARYSSVSGEVETAFANGRWKAGLRFALGLNVRDHYVAPKLSYVGWEPHELYLTVRRFGGEARTLGGFHRDHDVVAFGLRTKF